MLQLGIHRTEILQKHFDGIHLLLTADGRRRQCCRQRGRRSHQENESHKTIDRKPEPFPPIPPDMIRRQAQS